MRIREFFKQLGGYGGTFLIGINLESYIRGLKKDLGGDPVLDNFVDMSKKHVEVLTKLSEIKIENAVDKQKMEGKIDNMRTSLEIIDRGIEQVNTANEQLKNSSLAEETKAVLYKQIDENSKVVKDQVSKVTDTIGSMGDILKSIKSDNKLVDMNTFTEYLDSIRTAIDLLSMEQKGALINVFGCIVIFVFLSSLIGAIAGDRIVEYYRLEQRLPLLAKFFTVRRKIR